MFKILIGTVALIVGAAGTFYGYMGGFTSVEIGQTQFQETEVFFTTHRGPYENLSASWEKFGNEMSEMGMEDCDAVGVYLDDPDTAPEKLRSIIGCKMTDLTAEVREKVTSKFKTFTLPAADSFMGSFPYKNILSFWMAPSKVYPEMQNLIATNVITPSVAIETYGYTKGRHKIDIFMPAKMTAQDYQPLFDAFMGGE